MYLKILLSFGKKLLKLLIGLRVINLIFKKVKHILRRNNQIMINPNKFLRLWSQKKFKLSMAWKIFQQMFRRFIFLKSLRFNKNLSLLLGLTLQLTLSSLILKIFLFKLGKEVLSFWMHFWLQFIENPCNSFIYWIKLHNSIRWMLLTEQKTLCYSFWVRDRVNILTSPYFVSLMFSCIWL